LILLDSTVVVGFLDSDDALHQATVARLREIVGAQALVASVITYAEVMTGVALGHHSEDAVNGFFEALIKELLVVDRAVAARATALRGGRRSLRMPDALILATADLHDEIELVLCGDKDWPKIKELDCQIEVLQSRPGAARGNLPRPR
jgi:predicted nucleic acid-binding protein